MQKVFLCGMVFLLSIGCVPKSEHEKVQADLSARNKELQGEQAKVKQVSEDLEKQHTENQKLTAELAKAQSANSDLKTELSKTRENLDKELAKKPVLPIKVTFRTAVLG